MKFDCLLFDDGADCAVTRVARPRMHSEDAGWEDEGVSVSERELERERGAR